jgi:drug/metabolite transporter (DMT)-like permease
MSWLTLTVIAQFLNSIVALFDKYLVTSKKITTPILYVFYTGVLTCLGILIYIPSLFFSNSGLPRFSHIQLLTPYMFFIVICIACSQLYALYALFSCLRKNDASDVVPVLGSFSAIYALIIGYFFTGLTLSPDFAFGFALLIFGTFLISHIRFSVNTFLLTLIAGLGFAVQSTLLKELLNSTSFDTGFFWMSSVTSVMAFCLLFFPQVRKTFHSQRKEKHIKSTGALLIGNKLIAGIAGILIIKAIQIGEVSLIQALGGLQFVFLFVLAAIFGPFTGIDFGENIKRKDLYHKFAAISIIFIGFVLLFI